MGGETYYGRCCNRVIVSRLVRYCGYCGGPLKRNKATGEMERTTQKTYAEGMKSFDTLMVEMDDARAQVDHFQNESKIVQDRVEDLDEYVLTLRTQIRDLEALVAIAAVPAGPRAPDIVVVNDSVPGVSGALASVQEACGHISERGVNIDKPCIRPRENPERKHKTGRHRY